MTRPVLALDPGTTRTGWVLLARDGTPLAHGKDDNELLLSTIRQGLILGPYPHPDVAVIEWTQPRGMLASLERRRLAAVRSA